MDWDDEAAEADVDLIKKKAMELLEVAVVVDDGTVEQSDERYKHRSGRLYFPGFVQSFEVRKKYHDSSGQKLTWHHIAVHISFFRGCATGGLLVLGSG